MKWLDILIRAGKTAYQAFIAAIIPLGDLLQNALAGAEVQASNEVPITVAETRVVTSDDDTRRIPRDQ